VPEPALYLGGLHAAAALAWGLLALWRRKESWLAAALIATAGIYLGARIGGTPYTSAKALVIFAAVGMLIALRGLLSAETEIELLKPLRKPLLVAFMVAAAVSSFLPLRSAAVGPSAHAEELMSFRSTIGRGPVLYLGRDQFAAWELFHARLGTPVLNHYNQKGLHSQFPSDDKNVKLDWDALEPYQLDLYPWAITSSAAYTSEAPANWRLVQRTLDYLLWQRVGPTPRRQVPYEPTQPGAVLDCSYVYGSTGQFSHVGTIGPKGTASVFPSAPVVGQFTGWTPSDRVTNGQPATQVLTLPRGRWALSLQYVSTQEANLTAPGLDSSLPANLDFRGPSSFWPAGEVTVGRMQALRFTFSVDRPTLFGRLIGAEAVGFPLQLTAIREGRHLTFPRKQACGRYVDFVVAPG
jgi:hypothetical protein